MRAAFSNAGQLCVSMERMFVADQVYDRFVERFVARTEAMTLGADPRLGQRHGLADLAGASSTPSPPTSRTPWPRAPGCSPAAGPGPTSARSSTSRPSSRASRPDMTCFGNETFGPVVSVYRFHDEADAIARANDGEYGLNASIYSQDGAARPRDRPADPVRHGQHQRGVRRDVRQHRRADGRHARVRARPAPGREGVLPLHRDAVGRDPAADSGSRRCSGCPTRRYAQGDDRQPAAAEEAGPRMSGSTATGSTTTSWSSAPGFGGSVTALRLTEKGYRVGVLEAGARFEDDDFADDLVRHQALPVPARGRLLRHPAHRRAQGLPDPLRRRRRRRLAGLREHALRAARRRSTTTRRGRDITDWRAELAPYYDQAKRMLGVVENPLLHAVRRGDEAGRRRPGRRRHVPPDPGRRVLRRPGPGAGASTVADPYFGGAGPDRNPCRHCGECMTGCRHNAKNTLVKNYLYLAEQNGARVLPLTTVTRIAPRDRRRRVRRPRPLHQGQARPAAARPQVLTAEQVVLAAVGARHPAAAAPDEGRGPPARGSPTGSATCRAPTPSRSSATWR